MRHLFACIPTVKAVRTLGDRRVLLSRADIPRQRRLIGIKGLHVSELMECSERVSMIVL